MGANTKIHGEQGGKLLVVESGGVINIKTGGELQFNGSAAVALAAANGLLAMTGGVQVAGHILAFGEVTLDGSNPTPVTTGLTTVLAAFVIQKSTATPGDDPSGFTVSYSGGTLNIYAWKNTSGTDPTLVASTDSAAVLCWFAIGT